MCPQCCLTWKINWNLIKWNQSFKWNEHNGICKKFILTILADIPIHEEDSFIATASLQLLHISRLSYFFAAPVPIQSLWQDYEDVLNISIKYSQWKKNNKCSKKIDSEHHWHTICIYIVCEYSFLHSQLLKRLRFAACYEGRQGISSPKFTV